MLLPTNDKVKVLIYKDQFGLGIGNGAEHGTVVAIPQEVLYLGYHSFAFDGSLSNKEISKQIYSYYEQFMGKIVFWEALQDRGRRFQEGEDEFVFLNMTDIIAYETEKETKAYLIDDVRAGGFKV